MVLDYSHGKVYKISSPSCPELGVYIGSTVETLSRRIASHRSHFHRWQAGKNNFVTSFDILKAGDAVITLLEDVPCERKEQLLARERHWVEVTECVNRCLPGRTKSQYTADHHDSFLSYWKDYRVQNHERISAQRVEYRRLNQDRIRETRSEVITCECGSELLKVNLSAHRKTKKHNDLMEEKATTIPVQPE